MRKALLAVLGVISAVACTRTIDPEQYSSPQTLLEAAISEKERGNCIGAMPALRSVMFELPPRDPQIAVARFHLADCQVDQGEYLEGSRQFRSVADEFPTHELATEALLRSGNALAHLWKRPELDPTYGMSAMATYTELINRYPVSAEADSARRMVAELSNRFAEKQFRAGRFYYRLKAYDSAIIYFESIVADYSRSDFVTRALLILVDIYQKLGYEQERAETCDHLYRFYPDAPGLSDTCVGRPPT